MKEDFLRLFNLPGLLGGMALGRCCDVERLFVMFDVNRDEKIYWTDFMRGLKQCMFADESELDGFIFHFFSLNE